MRTEKSISYINIEIRGTVGVPSPSVPKAIISKVIMKVKSEERSRSTSTSKATYSSKSTNVKRRVLVAEAIINTNLNLIPFKILITQVNACLGKTAVNMISETGLKFLILDQKMKNREEFVIVLFLKVAKNSLDKRLRILFFFSEFSV